MPEKTLVDFACCELAGKKVNKTITKLPGRRSVSTAAIDPQSVVVGQVVFLFVFTTKLWWLYLFIAIHQFALDLAIVSRNLPCAAFSVAAKTRAHHFVKAFPEALAHEAINDRV